jgi:hypothetical protein
MRKWVSKNSARDVWNRHWMIVSFYMSIRDMMTVDLAWKKRVVKNERFLTIWRMERQCRRNKSIIELLKSRELVLRSITKSFYQRNSIHLASLTIVMMIIETGSIPSAWWKCEEKISRNDSQLNSRQIIMNWSPDLERSLLENRIIGDLSW